jgi:hypothetical protein
LTHGISWVESWETSIDGRVNHYFLDIILLKNCIGVLGGIFHEGWIEYISYIFSLLINGLHDASCVSTLQENFVVGRCSMSFLVWDPRITLSFILVHLVDHRILMEFLEEKKNLGREDCNVPIFGFPYLAVRCDIVSLCQPDQRIKMTITMRSGNLEELYGTQAIPFTMFHHQHHFCIVFSWFCGIPMIFIILGYY